MPITSMPGARLPVAALLVAVLLAACGGGTSAPPATSVPAATSPAAESPSMEPAETVAPAASIPATAAPATPAAVAPAFVDAIDACALLTAEEVATALGVSVDRVAPMPGSTALPGSRTCFYRPPGVADGPQVNVAVLAAPDYSRPADPSPAAGLEDASGAWWPDTLTNDLKLEVIAPSGVRLTLAYQDTASPNPPTEGALTFLVPLAVTALGRLP